MLARWTSWGAIPGIFDDADTSFAQARERLGRLLSPAERGAARQTVLSAHFTDPRIASFMWAAVQRLGFTEGPVLEPGCGSGIFLATAPNGAEPVGVEVDPVTAEIAGHLNPHAQVRAQSFAESRFDTRFAAVVGNVPFGQIALHDPDGNAGRHTLHNHFTIKSLQHTAPGGIVAVLCSRFLLDAKNPAARREIAQLGELLGAVRLPAGTHRAIAGTDVVTDLLVLQRHTTDDNADRPEPRWLHAVDVDGHQFAVNTYFADHPEQVLGTVATKMGQRGPELTVTATGPLQDVPGAVDGALRQITAAALDRGATVPPVLDLSPRIAPATTRGDARAREGWGHIASDGEEFTIVGGGGGEVLPLAVPASQRAETLALLELRDGARELLEHEYAGAADEDLTRARDQLRGHYEAYVQRWGPINRFTRRRTGRVDGHGNETFSRVAPPTVVRMRSDPLGPLVTALELFDEATQNAAPAQILTERVLVPRTPILSTDDPEEAIAVCLDRHGRLTLEDLGELLDRAPGQVAAVLGDRVFEDPDSGRLLPAAEYLSGDVRAKLARTRALLDERPDLAGHARALTAVMPADVPLDEIQARLGAAWIDADTHRMFLAEILGDGHVYVEHPGGSTWAVRGDRRSVAATVEWGTQRMPATDIAEQLMRQKPLVVRDRTADGERTVVNPQETAAAIDKGEALQERFAEWVWEEPARAGRLVTEYNRRFNSVVLRDYSGAGTRLSLPGLAQTFTPRPHQRAGVARMLAEPTVGLFHDVGAGKTATVTIGAMELRRLGMVKKPAVVVPNHMLEQFSREWLALYPRARVLAAGTRELTRDRRREFVARIASHDWDAVIMTRTAFERLALRPENQAAFIENQLTELETQLACAKGTSGRVTVKGLEAQLQREREKAKRLMDTPVDPGISFEDCGIDYLIVDEAHDYKNLRTISTIPGAAIDGSARATDLESKLQYLRGRHGERVATFATATAITNSITEAHVMMRYLRPDRLRAAGVENFDAWAATFARTVSGVEITADGAGFHQKTRFAKFQNVPEMLSTWHVFADVKTAQDLGLPRPLLSVNDKGDREPTTIVVPPSAAVSEYVADLGRRAERVRSGTVDATQDNMLKISGDGRKAALDMRLIDGTVTLDEQVKLQRVADQVAADWLAHRDAVYLDPATGQPSAVRGALQIVFCDLSTPRAQWNAYDELRGLLADRGLPREQVRFIHEAKNDAEKARLFAACRSGQVAVIIGSTARMGVGTNIQTRAVSLHHIDCPWRPSDVQQRDGRALRQGNQNQEISIYRYVTENSFDAFSWQTIARKLGFTQQLMRGDRSLRTVEDISQEEMTAHQVVALASGNPLLLDKHQADVDLAHLEQVQRNHHRNHHLLQDRRAGQLHAAAGAARDAELLTTALQRQVTSTRGERFAMTIDGHRHTDRSKAAEALSRHIDRQVTALRSPRGPLGVAGQLGGLQLHAELHTYPDATKVVTIALAGLPVPVVDGELQGLAGIPAGKMLRSLEHRINTLQQRRDTLLADQEQHAATAHQAAEQLTRPFKRAAELDAARRRVAELDRQIAEKANPTDTSVQERQADLVRLTTEAAHLERHLSQLPTRELDRIQQIAGQIDDLKRSRDTPATHDGPQHYRQAATATNAERITALTTTHNTLTDRLQRRTAATLEDLERKRDSLTRRRGEVDDLTHQIRDSIIRTTLQQPPTWLTEHLGPPPFDDTRRDLWTETVKTIIDAQLRRDPGGALDAGLPDHPTPQQQPHVDRAARALRQFEGGTGRER